MDAQQYTFTSSRPLERLVKGSKHITVFRLNKYFYYVKYKMNLAYETQTLQTALLHSQRPYKPAAFHTNTVLRKLPGYDLGNWWK